MNVILFVRVTPIFNQAFVFHVLMDWITVQLAMKIQVSLALLVPQDTPTILPCTYVMELVLLHNILTEQNV